MGCYPNGILPALLPPPSNREGGDGQEWASLYRRWRGVGGDLSAGPARAPRRQDDFTLRLLVYREVGPIALRASTSQIIVLKAHLTPTQQRDLARGLRLLGCKSYKEYLRSPHWRRLVREWRKKACEHCGAKKWLCLHH